MRNNDFQLYISDIFDCICKIEKYIDGIDYDNFCKNSMIIDAVIRNLEVLGEAARNIPEEVIVSHPEIPWKRMIGLRNVLIHGYFGVDLSIIWQIITSDIPETKLKIGLLI